MQRLLECIRLIILKQQNIQLQQIDSLTFHQGLIDLLALKVFFTSEHKFHKQFCQIIKILRDNWSQTWDPKGGVLEDALKEIELPKEVQEVPVESKEVVKKTKKSKAKISFFKPSRRISVVEIENPLEILQEKIDTEKK